MIGEICALQGYIESCMERDARVLLGLTPKTMSKIFSASIRVNADIWIQVIRERCKHQETIKEAEKAYKEIADLSKDRNDFVHAVYQYYKDLVVATNIKKGTFRHVKELKNVRDQAARVAQKMTYIDHWILTDRASLAP
jgi:hypothetical protein